ncbi:S-formylglutathione hydrolase FrmB [Spinactinospora alkalitolerans]|uniref:S-formylglutathione hydrolase FrmB n=1 Tax=Spinactinospora alkalitolerans TaxID=687207 RepID=A0A852TYS2_9ACTN|nr:alpha/beta hydrolase-fold protein [Spinactinospora alkalitolerans]NYE48951.1 S-formylglutathione hydrolase FrmB [Spinactinospora alkalitolerans]
MLPWSGELAGRIERRTLVSERLRGNPLGDPHERPVLVQVPPGYADSDRRYPVVYVIQGFTGHVGMWDNRTAFRRPFPELADAVFAAGQAPPAILVYVDAWTSLGGSQYLDSPGTGDYHSYLCDEVVPWVDAEYRTLAARDHRAISGKSSGGYGAMVTAMLRPEVFGALATHAGDALFELSYQPFFPRIARTLRDEYGGSYPAFLADVRTRPFGTKDGDGELIEMYAYAAAYSAEPDGTVLLPFDDLGRIVPEVWRRWLAMDPVLMAAQEAGAEALRSMRAVWIDAGDRDEFYLDLGATAFRRAVAAAGVPDERVRFELFDAGHGAIEYRYAPAVAWLAERIAG